MRLPRAALFLIGVLFLYLPVSAFSAQARVAPPPVAIPAPPLGGLLQVLLGLAVVLAAVWATAWLLRRFAPGQGMAGGALRVVSGVMVGPKERVVVVETGETWLLLGVTSGQVNLLHTMPRPEGVVTLQPSEFQGKNFGSWLKQSIQGRHGK
jgi:flagellar protein FliO/FliZ